jgi:hypothetical protein
VESAWQAGASRAASASREALRVSLGVPPKSTVPQLPTRPCAKRGRGGGEDDCYFVVRRLGAKRVRIPRVARLGPQGHGQHRRFPANLVRRWRRDLLHRNRKVGGSKPPGGARAFPWLSGRACDPRIGRGSLECSPAIPAIRGEEVGYFAPPEVRARLRPRAHGAPTEGRSRVARRLGLARSRIAIGLSVVKSSDSSGGGRVGSGSALPHRPGRTGLGRSCVPRRHAHSPRDGCSRGTSVEKWRSSLRSTGSNELLSSAHARGRNLFAGGEEICCIGNRKVGGSTPPGGASCLP